MLNTRDLERRWLRYKIKSFFPYIIILLSLLAIIVVISLYVNSETNKPVKKTVKQEVNRSNEKPVNSPTSVAKNITPTKEINKTLHVTTQQILRPSMDFIRDVQNSSKKDSQNHIQKQSVKKVSKPVKQPALQPVKTETIQTPKQAVVPKKVIIQAQTDLKEIQEVEQRFEKNNSPALSLFLARQYYARGNYEKSYNYALITNQLNKDIEASWLLFSKSLVKLGKKDKAVDALSEYIKYSNSSNAQLLLKDILSGKFR